MAHAGRGRAALAALGVLVAGLLMTGCGTRGANHAVTLSAVTTTITIDPQAGETFAPAPAGAAPAFSAQQAWAAYGKVDTSAGGAIPPNVTVQLGLLTLPVGPNGPGGTETYTAHNELVYGFSWHNCPASRNPKIQTLPPNPCIEWNFLDASTGRQIEETWQQ